MRAKEFPYSSTFHIKMTSCWFPRKKMQKGNATCGIGDWWLSDTGRQTDRTTDWLTHTLNRRKQDNNQRHRQQQMTHQVEDEDGRQERWLTGTVWSNFYWEIPRKQLERRRIPTRLKNSRHFLPTPVPGSQNYKDDDGRIVLSVYKELSLKLH